MEGGREWHDPSGSTIATPMEGIILGGSGAVHDDDLCDGGIDGDDGGRGFPLGELPKDLLLEILQSDELDLDCVSISGEYQWRDCL